MRSITLDRFIRDVAGLLDDPEAKRTYTKLLRIVISQMQDLRLNTIPDLKTEFFTVDINNVVDLPSDVIKPVHAGKYVEIGGVGAVYPLGQKAAGFELAMKPRAGFQCSPESLTNTGVVLTYQNYNGSDLTLPYVGSWYGESYGYLPDRVFGQWTYDKEWGRMIFEDGYISPGDTVIVKYTVYNDQFKTLPLEIVPMLQYKVLQQFFLTSNVRKAREYKKEFILEWTRFNRNSMSGFSYDDYILAFNRGYNDGIK